jgi:hypothetical protein
VLRQLGIGYDEARAKVVEWLTAYKASRPANPR